MSKLQNPVLLAKIGAPHGVQGQLRVASFTDDSLALGDYGPLFSKDGRKFTVKKARPAKNVVVVTFKEITSRQMAEQCHGLELYVERSNLSQPDGEDDFYLTDLIGMGAVDPSGQSLGRIFAIENFGAGDLLEITAAENSGKSPGNSWYIAFTRQNVPDIDLENRRITIVRPAEISEGDEDGKDLDAKELQAGEMEDGRPDER